MGYKSLWHRPAFWVFAILFVSVPVIFNACQGGGFAANTESLSSFSLNGPSCPKFSKATTDVRKPAVFANRKLLTKTKPQSGQDLVALIDVQCKLSSSENRRISDQFIRGRKLNPEMSRQAFAMKIDGAVDSENLENEINQDPCIIGVSHNRKYRLFAAYNDPGVLYQTHLSSIRADQSYEQYFNSALGGLPAAHSPQDVLIAVIDTGVGYTHSDLQPNVWQHQYGWGLNAYTLTSNLIDYNPGDVSSMGHGTHVSGLIAALANNSKGVAGVMPFGAKVMAIKVFWNENGELVSSTEVIVSGMLWALQRGAKVMNLSFGRDVDVSQGDDVDDPLYKSIITDAVNAGTVVVAASGNSSTAYPAQELKDTTYTVLPARYGAEFNGMIAVGSIDVTNSGKSSFSHWSTKYIEIAAPGAESGYTGLFSTLPPTSAGDQFGRLAGTSQAAPLVSAAAGLTIGMIRYHYGVDPSPAIVERLILDSAEKSNDLSAYFKDGNKLNLQNLINKIHAEYPLTATTIVQSADVTLACP